VTTVWWVVSTWQLQVNGAPVEPLTTIEDESYRATFVARTVPRLGLADSTLLVQRNRYVGRPAHRLMPTRTA
jgi:hypothetical protein